MHGTPTVTMSLQMHGLQLVYLEVHAWYLSACFARWRSAPAVLRTYQVYQSASLAIPTLFLILPDKLDIKWWH